MQELQIDIDTAKKEELRAALKSLLPEVTSLRNTVGRLLRQQGSYRAAGNAGHPEDFVPAGWAERHGISMPRADGIFESPDAWVRVKHGAIVGAGLKKQSILSLAISLELLDEVAERDGNLYKDWRAAFLSCVDPAKWNAEEGRGDPEAWSKEDRYSKLQRRVDQDSLAAMDSIVSGRPKARHLAAFQANQKAFVGAFRAVVKAMGAINQEAEKALNASRGHQSGCANHQDGVKL